jgi:hypothetical protein
MGTKAIAEALALLDDYGPNTQAGQCLALARTQLEAIRKAAKAMSVGPGDTGPTARSEAFLEGYALMESIAKEEP